MVPAMKNPPERASIESVRRYWSEHLNLTQFLRGEEYEVGSPRFFEAVRASLLRFPYKRGLLEDMWSDRAGERLLEIGCGMGADLVAFAQRGFDVTGVDLSSDAIAMTALHLETLELSGEAKSANAEELPFPSDTFDEVFSTGVFQHTPEPQKAIDEAIRVLRPGGNMTVVLYHRRSWFWLLSQLGRTNVEFQEEDAPIIDAYTRAELKRMFGVLDGLTIRMEHFRPARTPRTGWKATLYNSIVVPVAACIPAPLLRPFGFHAVIRGRKL